MLKVTVCAMLCLHGHSEQFIQQLFTYFQYTYSIREKKHPPLWMHGKLVSIGQRLLYSKSL